MSNEGISRASLYPSSLQETQKLHGQENAALQTVHKQKANDEVTQPAFVVDIGRPNMATATYVPRATRTEAASGDVSSRTENGPGFRGLPAKAEVAENARVQMNLRIEDQTTTEKINEVGTALTNDVVLATARDQVPQTTNEAKISEIYLNLSIASKLKNQAQPMEGTGEAVVAGENDSAQNSVQTDQSVASGALVVSDGHNVKATMQIDLVAMTVPKTLATPSLQQTEPVRSALPAAVSDTLPGVTTTEVNALPQPNRQEAIATDQEKIDEQNNDADARWLLLQDLVQSRKVHLGWQLDKTLSTAENPPTSIVTSKE